MELDKRIINDYKIYTCFDVEKAEQYIGKYGYFSDTPEDFNNITNCAYGILGDIDDNSSYTYLYKDDSTNCKYRLFLPEESVIQKEKKYRPFTSSEFSSFAVTQTYTRIIFRRKNTNKEWHVRYNGYINDNGVISVILGNRLFSLEKLLEYFELRVNGIWQPFGVEVEE